MVKPWPSLLCFVGYHTDILPKSGAGNWKHGCPCLSSLGGKQCCPRAGRRERVWSSAASWLTAFGWQQRCVSAINQPFMNMSTEAWAPCLSCHFILLQLWGSLLVPELSSQVELFTAERWDRRHETCHAFHCSHLACRVKGEKVVETGSFFTELSG